MAGLYGYTWTKQNGLEPTPEWELCLADATPDSLKMGIGRMAKDEKFAAFPPTPMQFQALCLPRGEDLGLPTFDEAFDQATKANTDKHPSVIYAIWQIDDNFGFRQMKTEAAKKVFIEVWNKTLMHVMAGGELPEKPVEVEEVHTKANPEAVADTRQGLKGLFP